MFITDEEWLKLLKALGSLGEIVYNINEAIARGSSLEEIKRLTDNSLVHRQGHDLRDITDHLINKQQYSLEDKVNK